ncbi:MAG TPA: hypothetical protein VIO60_00350 [Rectinemataceae bacterium]
MRILFDHRRSTDSTMNLARCLASMPAICEESDEKGPFDLLVAMADTQTAGRGRVSGRRWEDRAGSSFLATLGFPGIQGLGEALPLKMGLAVVKALGSRYGAQNLSIKWPNDILAPKLYQEGKGIGKLGGILCEASGSWFFSGIGLNIRKDAYDPSRLPEATSLEEALGDPCRGMILEVSVEERRALAETIGDYFLRLTTSAGWKEEVLSLLWGKGSIRSFELGTAGSGRIIEGKIHGIDEDGALVIELETGELASFHSGELRFLRSPVEPSRASRS